MVNKCNNHGEYMVNLRLLYGNNYGNNWMVNAKHKLKYVVTWGLKKKGPIPMSVTLWLLLM